MTSHRQTKIKVLRSSVDNLAILLLDLATFQTTLATFFSSKKHLATNLSIFKMYLATFEN